MYFVCGHVCIINPSLSNRTELTKVAEQKMEGSVCRHYCPAGGHLVEKIWSTMNRRPKPIYLGVSECPM